jgi:hypothetical protein
LGFELSDSTRPPPQSYRMPARVDYIGRYQTVLLPHLEAEEVKRLNHLPYERLPACAPDVRPELDRLFKVVEPFLPQHRIHYAPDIFDVMLNIDEWNSEILTAAGIQAWGRAR